MDFFLPLLQLAGQLANSTQLRPLAQLFVPPPCFDKIFFDYDYFDSQCNRIILSKCLGYGIIVGSALVKLPQIEKIYRERSVAGLSLVGVLLELVALSLYAAYTLRNHYPFSAWGEVVFLLVQTIAIAMMIQARRFGIGFVSAFLAGYAAFLYVLSPQSALLTLLQLEYLQSFNILVVGGAKSIQAVSNWRQGHTGQLSAVTVLVIFFGSLARIFTTVQETHDRLLLLMSMVAASANTILAAQMLYYWKVDAGVAAKRRRGKRRKAD